MANVLNASDQKVVVGISGFFGFFLFFLPKMGFLSDQVFLMVLIISVKVSLFS
jgi:hypothetical protein